MVTSPTRVLPLLSALVLGCDRQLPDEGHDRTVVEDSPSDEADPHAEEPPASSGADTAASFDTATEVHREVAPESSPTPTPVPNRPPSCAIVQPLHGETFDSGTSVRFEASVHDPEEGPLQISWTSDPYGPMVLGNSFGFILPPGVHHVSVDVVDAQGEHCRDMVDIEIEAPAPGE